MDKRYLATFGIILLFIFFARTPVLAQQNVNWITECQVYDLTGKLKLSPSQPLIAGHAYNVTVKINVPYTVSSNKFEVFLDESMDLYGAQYWYVLSSNYAGYEPSNFIAGSKVQRFSQVQGILMLSATFMVPTSLIQKTVDGVTFHFERNALQLITVKIVGGDTVGAFTIDVIDQSIQSYVNEKAQKSSLISQGKISASYSSLVDSILAKADNLFKLGLVDQALELIKVIDSEYFPQPPSGTLMLIFQVATAILAVLVIFWLIMYFRKSGQISDLEDRLNGARTSLAGLQVKVAKYDKNLADEIELIKKKLGE